MFDDEPVVSDMDHPEHGALRLPDGRALAWAEYGSPRGLPCLLIPDISSSRLAPGWLLHDSALPSAVRLLALDRPGTGASDPVGLGGVSDPAADLARMVTTLAVGRVCVIGIGRGADEAFAFARRSPQLVASVSGVSVRLDADPPTTRRRFRRRHPRTGGAVAAQWHAAVSDLRDETAWSLALPQLSPSARAALGERWQESDFRAAVAADLGVSSHHWNGVDDPGGAADWIGRPDAAAVPTRLWHGQQESTSLEDIGRVLAGHEWELSAVAGPTAALGYWPQILAAAINPFRPALAG